MARFDPPGKFTFKAEDWTDWISEFKIFRNASKLSEEQGEVQRDALLYAMGAKEAQKIFKTFSFKTYTRKETNNDGDEVERQIVEKDTDFNTVVEKFTNYFVPTVNIRYERARFTERCQVDEPVESFLRDLYSYLAQITVNFI